MRKLIVSIIIILFCAASNIWAQQCDIIVDANEFIVDGDNLSISPGNTICISESQKDYLLIKNIHGTESSPITIKNYGGQVIFDTDHFYGIKIANCSYIKFLGTGHEEFTYGFKIKRVGQGAGFSIDELSTNIEVSNVEISNTFIAGLYAKTDPDCSFTSSRDNFTMYSLHIHNCYFHDIGDEGMYIGHSKYVQGVHLDCDGNDTIIYPHVIKDVKIYNNVLEHLGWDGIQVSSADEDCSIYDNIIRYDSDKETTYQMSGILIGGGSKCDCYNNQIIDGKGDGIDVLGLGDFKVFNNLIVRAGKSFQPGDPNSSKHGIYVGDVFTLPNSEFKLYNNTIVSPKSYGITYNNNVAQKGILYNNLIVDPGQKSQGDLAFINNLVSGSKLLTGNNLNAYEIGEAGFENPASDNFQLSEQSVAVDLGKNLSSEGIIFDILNNSRPYNTFFDIGAYEFRPIGIGEEFESKIKVSDVFPNPSQTSTWVSVNPVTAGIYSFVLFTTKGKKLASFSQYCYANTDNKIKINLENIKSQICILQIKTTNTTINRKIIIQ